MQSGQYVGFRNVDFGNRLASHVVMRVNMLRSSGRVRIYADHPTEGQLLATVNATEVGETNKWVTVTKALDLPIGGIHDIYLVVNGITKVNLSKVNWFSFEANNQVYADITNNGGTLKVSDDISALDLASLTDDNPLTEMVASLKENGECWFEYVSPSPVRLQGYSLFSGITSGAEPLSWALLASTDGNDWETLDVQDTLAFSACCEKKQVTVSTDAMFNRFRLYSLKDNIFPIFAHASVTHKNFFIIKTP